MHSQVSNINAKQNVEQNFVNVEMSLASIQSDLYFLTRSIVVVILNDMHLIWNIFFCAIFCIARARFMLVFGRENAFRKSCRPKLLSSMAASGNKSSHWCVFREKKDSMEMFVLNSYFERMLPHVLLPSSANVSDASTGCQTSDYSMNKIYCKEMHRFQWKWKKKYNMRYDQQNAQKRATTIEKWISIRFFFLFYA